VYGNIRSITQSGIRPTENDATVSLTEYRAYDAKLNLCKVSRADVGTRVYRHNVFNEVIGMAEGVSGGSVTDCESNVDSPSHADANKLIRVSYDNFGEMAGLDYVDANSPDKRYVRDGNGNVLRVTSGQVSRTYNYNSLDLLVDEQIAFDGKRFSLGYDYDELGNVLSLTYPNDDVVTYNPNGFGEPTVALGSRVGLSDIDYATNAQYYPTGQLRRFSYGNGIVHETTLDSANLPTRLLDRLPNGSEVALDYNYTYDGNQNITSLLLGEDDAQFSLTTLSYDGLNRLISSVGNAGIGSSIVSYDGLGNIVTYNNAQQNLLYHYSAQNQLIGIDNDETDSFYSFGYDDRGNVTGNGFHGFNYNRANQMVSTQSNNTYLYDGDNRRVMQTDSEGTSYSVYSQDGTLLYRETDDGPINYIYLGKKLIAKDGFVADKSTDQHFYPYGSSVEGEGDDIGYTGHKFDKDLGLVYMQARYYDPMIGRFYSNDPVDALGHMQRGNSIAHGFNRYTYANNNPYKYTDPDGEFAFPLLFTPPALAALGKAAAFVGSAAAAAFFGSEAINAYNDSADPVEGILEGATPGEKTKGRTKNFDKSGGIDQANSDFDDIVDPDSVEPITDGKGGEGRKGTVNDGSGRKVNVRPNSSDGRPTVEIQDGKNKTKIRFDEESN
jgi:RHS repeat-associated protein